MREDRADVSAQDLHPALARRSAEVRNHSPGADPEALTRLIMTSREFASDMAGFDANDIVDVQSVLLDPTSFSPIR